MDVVLLSGLHFVLTIAFQYLFPPLTIALGMAFIVFTLTASIIHWTFHGKVRLDDHSY